MPIEWGLHMNANTGKRPCPNQVKEYSTNIFDMHHSVTKLHMTKLCDRN